MQRPYSHSICRDWTECNRLLLLPNLAPTCIDTCNYKSKVLPKQGLAGGILTRSRVGYNTQDRMDKKGGTRIKSRTGTLYSLPKSSRHQASSEASSLTHSHQGLVVSRLGTLLNLVSGSLHVGLVVPAVLVGHVGAQWVLEVRLIDQLHEAVKN